MTKTRTDRVVTKEDIRKYDSLVEMYMKKSVYKNWTEASMNKKDGDISLGNSGYTMNDIRQHLRAEVVIALKNYDETKGTKESTFVFGHLFNRVGQLMKKLTSKTMGYGLWTNNLEIILNEFEESE